MANIIHNRIPINEDGRFLIDSKLIWDIHNSIQRNLDNYYPDEHYLVITTPSDLSCVDGDSKIIQIKAKEYSANELLEAIEKANMYDGLCK